MSESISGVGKPDLRQLPPLSNRNSFIYLERCRINCEDGALTASYSDGIVCIPSAVIAVLLLGPGVDISAKAIGLVSNSAITVIWVGEHGVRFYAHGRALSNHTRYLERQAALVSNMRLHLSVVRKMYDMRFKGEDSSKLTLQQLRGREGSRMRRIYRDEAKKWGIDWRGRSYDPDDFDASDPVNKALSAGNVCLYGLATAAIVSIGCSPGLGFIHVGHEMSFAYDIADLYKAEYTIPLAFELGSKNEDDIERKTRQALRDKFAQSRLIERMVKDLKYILDMDDDEDHEVLYLWDNLHKYVDFGIQYREHGGDYDDSFINE